MTESRPQLYTPHSAVIATIMGSLLAGAVIIALNYRALGRRDLATRTVLIGFVALGLLMALATLLPDGPVAGVVILVVQIGMVYGACRFLQEAAIRYHVEHGGGLYSPFRALAVGLLVGVAFAMVFVAVLLALGVTPAQ
jgi:hypothetical protein